MVGKGIGRFPAIYAEREPAAGIPGTLAFVRDGANGFLRLDAVAYSLRRDRLLRVVQRVSNEITPPLRVTFDARVTRETTLDLEVCGRQLLYPQGCARNSVRLKPSKPEWRSVAVLLSRGAFDRGRWFTPRRAYFALALASGERGVDLDNLRLIDGSGENLLRNGDFSSAGDFWFFISDRYHLPWHIENLFVNVLFDQGLLGLTAFLALCLAAALRAWRGIGRWPQAPYFLASVAGFVSLGLVDGLLDAPRLATLFYLVSFTMLIIRPGAVAVSPLS